VVIAGSRGFASGLVMTVRYEVIVVRSEVMVITCEGIALRSRLRSIAWRDVDTWSSDVFSRSPLMEAR